MDPGAGDAGRAAQGLGGRHDALTPVHPPMVWRAAPSEPIHHLFDQQEADDRVVGITEQLEHARGREGRVATTTGVRFHGQLPGRVWTSALMESRMERLRSNAGRDAVPPRTPGAVARRR